MWSPFLSVFRVGSICFYIIAAVVCVYILYIGTSLFCRSFSFKGKHLILTLSQNKYNCDIYLTSYLIDITSIMFQVLLYF